MEVQNKFGQYNPCRALLDSVSQSHYITNKFLQILGLSRIQTNATKQGLASVNTETDHSVSLHLSSRHTDWHTTLKYAIFRILIVPHHPPRWKKYLENSQKIKLADEHFVQPGVIDLLFEVYLFYEML